MRLQSKTTVGVQFNRNIFDRNGASGTQCSPPGATTVTSGAARRRADESDDETRTLGGFLEEHVAFSDRLFVTGARALRPQQRVRRELQDGVLSEARRLVGRVGRSLLPDSPAG